MLKSVFFLPVLTEVSLRNLITVETSSYVYNLYLIQKNNFSR